MERMLSIFSTSYGFITEETEEDIVTNRRSWLGPFQRIDIWIREPNLWLWLLENNILRTRESSGESDSIATRKIMLSIPIENEERAVFDYVPRFYTETDFILSLIDKIELEMDISGNDYMRLNILEDICHNKNINLLDFFYALEMDAPLFPARKPFEKIETSASTYYQALEILANAKEYTYKKISNLSGISHVNLLSDKSDSFRGKRKTIEIRTLFRLTNALEISMTLFMALCNRIKMKEKI